MPTDDLTRALAALALIGLGAAAYSALDTNAQRRRFEEALRRGLAQRHIGLVDATIARAPGGGRLWRLTVNLPWQGVHQQDFLVTAGVSETNPSVLQDILASFRAESGLKATG